MQISTAMGLQLQQVTSQLQQYNTQVAQLLELIQTLTQQQEALQTWLAANPNA